MIKHAPSTAAPVLLPPAERFIDSILSADVGTLKRRFGPAPPPNGVATFSAWPWEIASTGTRYLHDHFSAATTLAKVGSELPTSTGGAAAIAAVASDPKDSANTGQVLTNGIFSNALNSLQADQLLRTAFIGWAGGAQVVIFGGSGGEGVAYDITNQSSLTAVGYGSGNIGPGIRAGTGLLLGAFSRLPSQLNSSTAVLEFAAGFAGVGALVAVVMDLDLNFLGMTILAGFDAGVSAVTGYGRISTE